MIGKKRVTRYLAILALAGGLAGSLASPALAASRVTLNSGREIVGDVQKHDTDGYWVTTKTGKIHVPAKDVKSIVAVRRASAKDVLKEQASDASNDALEKALDRRRKASEANSEEDANAEYEKIMEQLRWEILSGLRSSDRDRRIKAIDRLVTLWPTTASVLDAALEDDDAGVRKEATRLLSNPKLDGCAARAVGRLRDPSTIVQVLSVRAMRMRKMKGVEPALVRALTSVREWAVHQEILRTLEEIGTDRCAPAVVKGLADAKKDQQKRFYARVLKAVFDVDHGTDVAAWERELEALRTRQMLSGKK